MSTTDRTAAIRARLAAATPGPWELATCCYHADRPGKPCPDGDTCAQLTDFSADGVTVPGGSPYRVEDLVVGTHNHGEFKLGAADGRLIANAPADLSYLLAEVERLRARIYQLEQVVTSAHGALVSYARDMSTYHRDAWLYGLIVGWGDAFDEVADQHGWTLETRDRLRRMHENVQIAEEQL